MSHGACLQRPPGDPAAAGLVAREACPVGEQHALAPPRARWIAVADPAGPAPTTRTSKRSTASIVGRAARDASSPGQRFRSASASRPSPAGDPLARTAGRRARSPRPAARPSRWRRATARAARTVLFGMSSCSSTRRRKGEPSPAITARSAFCSFVESRRQLASNSGWSSASAAACARGPVGERRGPLRLDLLPEPVREQHRALRMPLGRRDQRVERLADAAAGLAEAGDDVARRCRRRRGARAASAPPGRRAAAPGPRRARASGRAPSRRR